MGNAAGSNRGPEEMPKFTFEHDQAEIRGLPVDYQWESEKALVFEEMEAAEEEAGRIRRQAVVYMRSVPIGAAWIDPTHYV